MEASSAKRQSKWSAQENALIVQLRGDGMKWDDISKRLPGRSAISCRLHYQNFLERRAEWSDEQKTKLARLYDRHKKEMWTNVAKDLEMPWRAVEAKHWELGAEEMARRAGVTAFTSSGATTTATAASPAVPQAITAGPHIMPAYSQPYYSTSMEYPTTSAPVNPASYALPTSFNPHHSHPYQRPPTYAQYPAALPLPPPIPPTRARQRSRSIGAGSRQRELSRGRSRSSTILRATQAGVPQNIAPAQLRHEQAPAQSPAIAPDPHDPRNLPPLRSLTAPIYDERPYPPIPSLQRLPDVHEPGGSQPTISRKESGDSDGGERGTGRSGDGGGKR